jgi:hypothetical protein
MFKKIALTLLITTPAFAHLLPDLRTATYPLRQRSIQVLSDGTKLLRFSNGVANVGHGPVQLEGGVVDERGKQKVWQRIFNQDGSSYTRLAGTFTMHPGHRHTHFDEFARYRLLKVVGRRGVGDVVAESAKVSFCLYDEYVYNSRLWRFSRRPVYRTCTGTIQGISVGWVDVYDKSLPGQHIDITDVPRGTYWLESTADPYNRIEELNEDNNTTRIKINI